MNYIITLPVLFFSVIMLYYSVLIIAGLTHVLNEKLPEPLDYYPSVSIFIPAHNEGVVIQKTLGAMTKIEYLGELTIYVLNDSSSDETGEIADAFERMFHNIKHIKVPPGEPRGKSRVLNYGLTLSNDDFFVVYDADNEPEPQAVRLLVETIVNNEKAYGAVGYVKTINEDRNILTRMISIEFQVFQLLMQSGRYKMFGSGALPGTNMIVRRKSLDEIGHYDLSALAEDSELTVRMYQAGGVIPVISKAVTWEQEPETLGIYLRQRSRWLQGNFYILAQMLCSKRYYTRNQLAYTFQHLSVYAVFLVFLLISHGWAVLGMFYHMDTPFYIPLLLLWYFNYIFFTLQLFIAIIVSDRIEPKNIFAAVIMYFTYSQMFIYIYFNALVQYIKYVCGKNSVHWDKTVRFQRH